MKQLIFNIYKPFFFLMMLIFVCSSVAQKQNERIDRFEHALDTSYLGAGWIIRLLMCMTPDEFNKAWDLSARIIIKKPWLFVCDTEEKYDPAKHTSMVIAQCRKIDWFLQRVVVDIERNYLIFYPQMVYAQSCFPYIISIFDYFKRTNTTSHHDFYAFYFDQCALFFLKNMLSVSCDLHDHRCCTMIPDLQKDYDELVRIFDRLRSTTYDTRYAAHVKRYYELFTLLKKKWRQTKYQQDIFV